MCGLGSSQSAPTNQLSTQTTSADPRAAAMYGQAWNQARPSRSDHSRPTAMTRTPLSRR